MTRQNIKVDFIPYYLQMANEIRKGIRDGKYKVGTSLPTEAQLAKLWKVSRRTVRGALGVLEKENLVRRIPAKGTFVNDPSKEESALYQNHKRERRRGKVSEKSIGVLIPSISVSLYPGIVRGVEDAAYEVGHQMVLGNYDVLPQKEASYLKQFINGGVKGVVSAPSYNSPPQPYLDIIEGGIPLVFVDIGLPDVETDLVATDNSKGARQAVEFMIRKGCGNIGIIREPPRVSSSKERYCGYLDALEKNNIPLPAAFDKNESFNPEAGYRMAVELLEAGVDGIFVANEKFSMEVMRAVREKNASVVVVSFDTPSIPPSLPYPIALVKQPRYEIGKAAAQLLLERNQEIKGGVKTPHRTILLDPVLVEVDARPV